ncbi:MAG TPA: PAS domain S-box protein [Kiritimatiellia bacterium]|mgnify:CR=1 FL=1|nr:PAS domain S-box protein [Kiritimatiellia bacterium]HMP33722.1 PAS domain S-box protein [Kiritimatiellia bacterium]
MTNEEDSDVPRANEQPVNAASASVPVWPKGLSGNRSGIPTYASMLHADVHAASGSLTYYLDGLCEDWVGVLGAYSLWIAVRQNGQVIAAASSFSERFQPLRERLIRGICPTCWQQVSETGEPVVIEETMALCGTCPLAASYHGRVAVAVRLMGGPVWTGILCASVPDTMADDEDLRGVFSRAGEDISRGIAAWCERDAVLHSEQVIQRIFEAAPVGIALVQAGRIVEANRAMTEVSGVPREQLIGLGFAQLFVDPDVRGVIERWVVLPVASPEARVVETRLECGPGGARDVRVEWMALEPNDQARGMIATVLDITEQKAAEREREEGRRLLESLMDSLPGMAYRCRFDAAWTMTFISRGGEELTGYARESLIENRKIAFVDLIHPDDRERVYQAIDGMTRGDRFVVEYRMVRADGEMRWVLEQGRVVEKDISGYPMVEGFILDITERRKLNENVLYMKKSESLAAMAGGVAHDFNNMLAAMIGNAELALEQVGDAQDVRHCLADLLAAGNRAAGLCHQLLSFCGNTRISDQVVDTSRLIHELTPLIRSTIHPDVTLHFDFGEALPGVRGDGAALRQLILQVVVNAAEAYLGKPGTVDVATGFAELEGRELADAVPVAAAPQGSYVWIEVRDRGCGISADVRRRMFDPFFSTKFTGRGMGLAAAQGIVRAHQGVMEVHSAPGRGATFRIYLPAAEQVAMSPPKPVASLLTATINRVLVVDDDPAMRLMLERMLKGDRIQVEVAADGGEAVRIFRQQPEAYDLVLMDLTMPVMDGIEAFLQMRSLVPGVRVILTTGYSEEMILSRIDPRSFAAILIKPFTREGLRAALQTAMEANTTLPR